MTKEIIPTELSEKIVEWTRKELENSYNLTDGWRNTSYFECQPFKQFDGFIALFRREHDQVWGPCLRIRLLTDVTAEWGKNQTEIGPGEYIIKPPIDDGPCCEELATIFIYMDKRRHPIPVVKKQATNEYMYDLFVKEVTKCPQN